MRKQVISDHAVRRWFERVEKVDLACAAHLADHRVLSILRAHRYDVEMRRGFITALSWGALQAGACGFCWQGYRFAIREGEVITIIPVKAKRRREAA